MMFNLARLAQLAAPANPFRELHARSGQCGITRTRPKSPAPRQRVHCFSMVVDFGGRGLHTHRIIS